MQTGLKIIVGIALLVIGIACLLQGYAINSATVSAIGWTGLLLGAFFTTFGIAAYLREQRKPVNTSYTELEKRLLIQSMACVANADGKVRDIEVTVICNIHEQLLHSAISVDDVQHMLADTESENILGQLKAHANEISPRMKQIIIQSCHLIMISDSEIVSKEESRIHEIGAAVGLTKAKVNELIASVST